MFVTLTCSNMRSVLQAANQNFQADECPVYGTYYFPEGGKVDEGKSEAIDKNDYYSTT